MNIYESVGLAWIVATATAAHIAIIVAVYRQVRRTLDLAKRGEVEEQRDVRQQREVRARLDA